MPLPQFILDHVSKATIKILDKDSEIIHAYIQLMNLVLDLTFTYLSLILLALSLLSLHYFNKRVIGTILSIVCVAASLLVLSTRSQYSANS